MFASDMTDKRLIRKIYIQIIQLSIKKTNDPIKKWTGELNKHFSKGDIQMANRYMKRCSMPLIVRETQLKTTTEYLNSHMSERLSSKRPQISDVWGMSRKREPLYTVGENVNGGNHCGKQYGGAAKKELKAGLSYDPVILLLDIYLRKIKHLLEKIHAF